MRSLACRTVVRSTPELSNDHQTRLPEIRRGFVPLGWLSLGAYAVGIEPMLLTHVKRYCLTPPHWPAGLKLRVVGACRHPCLPALDDAGADRFARRRGERAQPDVIVLLGDYPAGMRMVTGWVDASEWAPALSGLKAPLGVWSILGNHDWWEDRYRAEGRRRADDCAQGAGGASAFRCWKTMSCAWKRTGTASGSPGLPTSWHCSPAGPGAGPRFKGLDDLDGTLAKVSDQRADHPARARARHFPESAVAGLADPVAATPMADRSGCSAIRRWCRPASAIALPMAMSSRMTAI